MKTSLMIGTFLLVGAGASSLGALPNPYQGSDTLNDLTVQVLANLGLAANYIGGGSGNGQTAMVAGTQVSAPMSRMMNNGASICTKVTTEASGIVIGLDAVDVLASTVSGGSAACNSPGEGLVQSGSVTANGTTVSFATWKSVLALVYGGEKDATNPGQVICNGPQRTALVSNWSNIFQNQCANAAQATCGDTSHQTCTTTRGQGNIGTCTQPATAPLWHAFRRDDQSGTSDVFATLLGLSPNTSATANNGFGASPYCNAMNWDVTAGTNGTTCALGMNKQFTGPGGVYNSLAGEVAPAQIHRRPPPNTWGDFPDSATNTFTDADVTATSMQDNDPIRRPCVGTAVGLATKEAEEVCNIDMVSVSGKTVGQLGLVVAIPDAIYIQRDLSLNLFPTNQCVGAFLQGDAPQTYNCAPNKATKHSAECPNGDSDIAGACQWPSDNTAAVTTGCENTFTNQPGIVSPRNPALTDGRSYNLWYTDQLGVDGSVHLTKQSYTLAKTGGGTTVVTIDSAQGMGRIHLTSTIPAKLTGCKNASATDQIGCLVQADQCSIGYAGDAAKTWGSRAGGVASNNAALLVSTIAPTVTTVQELGTTGEYPLSRKLYFNTLEGWTSVQAGGATNADELTIATKESSGAFINPFLTANGFFTLGSQSPQGVDSPFCEDFNQQTVCLATSNDNACSRNTGTGVVAESAASTAKPTQSTVCGDGFIGPYEECDNGAANGTSGNNCLATCRCANVFVNGACN